MSGTLRIGVFKLSKDRQVVLAPEDDSGEITPINPAHLIVTVCRPTYLVTNYTYSVDRYLLYSLILDIIILYRRTWLI